MTTRSRVLWPLLGAGVVAVSVALTRHSARADVAPRIAHFSGSVVVQNLPSLLESRRLPGGMTVDVLRDGASARFYDSPTTLDSIVETWRAALAASGADVRVVAPEDIGGRRARVLVVPSSPCLTIASHGAIEAAANEGRGLIITGLTGNRDIGCRPIGYGFLVAATQAARVERLESRPMVYVTLPAGSPLTDGIPPGARLEINPGTQLALRGASRDAYYSDYSLRSAPADSQPLLDAAVSRSTLGRARVVYWGFELRDVATRPWSLQVARLLMRNSVTWAAAAPTVALEAWPQGRPAAAAIAQDVEAQFENAALALDSLTAARYPGTYFLTTRRAQSFTRLSRAMAAQGEAGSHSENHWVLGGNPLEVQRARLASTQDDLDDILGKPSRGLRPPEEQFDLATLRAWAAAGGTYVFGANDQRSVSPELLAAGKDTLVLIGRYGADDFAAVAQRRHVEDIFLDDFEQARALGGVYVLSYHSQALARAEWVPVLARAARAMLSDSAVWHTTTGEIAQWWRARAAVSAEVDATERDRVVVKLRNSGPSAIAGLVVHVRDVTSRKPARSEARLLAASPGQLRLFIPLLAAGATQSYAVTYESPVTVRERPAKRRPRPAAPPKQHWSWRRLIPWWR
jgi:peptidoglycan/xylan/chitin deacetylase (PgdA/CDA1 family)